MAHLYSLWMKAVWTILGWCTAAAAAAGAAMVADGCCCCSALGMPFRSSACPLGSPSGLLLADWGADELVGVVISMGSPGDGADIWMVGVLMMGMVTVRVVIGSSAW